MADPIEPVSSENPPCQENIIDSEIDILKTLPVIKHSTLDIGPVITGGVAMVRYPTEMAKEDNNLLAHALNLDSVYGSHHVSIPPQNDYYQEYLDRAEGREPSQIGKPDWD